MTAIISRSQCCFLYVDDGSQHSHNSKVIQFLTEIHSTLNLSLHRISTPWIDQLGLKNLMHEVNQSLSGQKRPALLVCGAYLEDLVTVCSLEALMEGYDVHLLCDLIEARNARLKPVLLLRLFQAGVVPSSLRQFIYMWKAAQSDHQTENNFQQLLLTYDELFSGRPA
jgi:hypothetical protein